MAHKTAVLRVLVSFYDDQADAYGIAAGVEILLKTYLDHFDDYGPVSFCSVEPDTTVIRGTQKDSALCAVKGCFQRGVAMRCPYDGTRHGHGRIHYEAHRAPHFAPQSELRFEPGDWRLICPTHGTQILEELGDKSAIVGDTARTS
jgi:hypothetical protein